MTESQRKPADITNSVWEFSYFFFLKCEARPSVLSEHSSLHLTRMIFLALDTMDVETWIILEVGLSTGCEIQKQIQKDWEQKRGWAWFLMRWLGEWIWKMLGRKPPKPESRGWQQGVFTLSLSNSSELRAEVASVTLSWGGWRWLYGRSTFHGEWW